jgi:hypothetical protein
VDFILHGFGLPGKPARREQQPGGCYKVRRSALDPLQSFDPVREIGRLCNAPELSRMRRYATSNTRVSGGEDTRA